MLNLQKSVDILLISESHLTPHVSNAAIDIPGFEVFCKDSGEFPNHGVCAFVWESIKVDCVNTSHPMCCPFGW